MLPQSWCCMVLATGSLLDSILHRPTFFPHFVAQQLATYLGQKGRQGPAPSQSHHHGSYLLRFLCCQQACFTIHLQPLGHRVCNRGICRRCTGQFVFASNGRDGIHVHGHGRALPRSGQSLPVFQLTIGIIENILCAVWVVGSWRYHRQWR